VSDATEGGLEHGVEPDAGEQEPTSLEDRLTRLDGILARLESDEVPLEQALELFEEGVGLVREAEWVLSDTQVRVEELLAGGETRELDVEEP
jgi:exodeoxyribonuclease VII small subunit